MSTPLPRWGVRFTANPLHRQQYLQDLYNNDNKEAYRGELFLNEVYEELYYVGLDGIAHTVNSTGPVSFDRINFTGLREFADDASAASAVPAVPVGGMYRTENILKVRIS